MSLPYINMTLALMQHFGVEHAWDGNTIIVEKQDYVSKDITVEADWSAASYYYALAAFADELDLTLRGLFKNSLQGDSVATELGFHFGIDTIFDQNTEGVLKLKKTGNSTAELFEWEKRYCGG